MPQIYDMGPMADGFTSPPKKGVLRILSASAGFERANLGTKGQHATPRPPKPLYIYACVCVCVCVCVWTLTSQDEQHLGIFERRTFRKIFGPVQNEDGSWRIRMNHELNELIENTDMVRLIKSRRIAWLGHVIQMDDKRTPKKILDWKPTGTRIRGRPRKRWIVDIEEDTQIIGIKGWRKQCKKREEWKRLTEKAKTHRGL